MDVREKLVKQAISHFWYGVSHDIFSEPVTTYAKLAIEALEKEKESGVIVQSEIDANTFQLMREIERLKEEKESLANAVNVLEEINSDLCKQIKGITVQEWISVKDRLPDTAERVLVCKTWLGRVYKPVYGYYQDFPNQKGCWYILTEEGYYPQREVTHWMPLPPAPKGVNI